jgi:Tol biopolymer transport system component
MMKQTTMIITTLVFLFLVSGCVESAPKTITEDIVVTHTPLPTIEIDPGIHNEPSATPETLSQSEPVATSIPAPIIERCVVSNQNLPGVNQGVLVLYQLDTNLDRTIFLYDMTISREKILSPLGWISSVGSVSPDRHYLLYEYDSGTDDGNRLVVVDYAGTVIRDFDNRVLPESWWDYYQWQTNDTLRVVVLDLGKRRALPRLYNITTEDYMPLKTDWPYVYKGENLDWGLDREAIRFSSSDGANIVYDPAITRVVYPKRGQTVSLTDVETGQELASIELPLWGRLPRWSPDGQNLVLIASMDPKAAPGHDEFFIVSRDGPEFKRLTHLTEKLETAHISEYAWSPDGSQIAFWLNTEAGDPTLEGTQSELAILDVASGEITKLCIQGISAPIRSDPMPLMTRTQPIWSPDGRQVVFTQLNPSLANTYDVLVLDLETKTALKIASNKQPVGWMINAPGPSAP